MDPRELIRQAAEEQSYFVTAHCLQEMDRDGLSLGQIEHAMLLGAVRKRNARSRRYTLVDGDVMTCVEVASPYEPVTVVTAGRERG